MRKILFCLILFLAVGAGDVFAGTFNLKSIGAVDTSGKQISHWWYSGSNPVFRGEATPGADITADIDGTILQVSADSAGDWVFQSVSVLTDGDHSVKFTSGGSEINFTLTIGAANVNWDAVQSGSGSALPTVGVVWPTMVTLGLGLVMVMMGKKVLT